MWIYSTLSLYLISVINTVASFGPRPAPAGAFSFVRFPAKRHVKLPFFRSIITRAGRFWFHLILLCEHSKFV